jgi:hypothetical protein
LVGEVAVPIVGANGVVAATAAEALLGKPVEPLELVAVTIQRMVSPEYR